METPVIHCPLCDHSIDEHSGRNKDCRAATCRCKNTPNLIAVAALFAGLTS